jgi:hypothetical protein
MGATAVFFCIGERRGPGETVANSPAYSLPVPRKQRTLGWAAMAQSHASATVGLTRNVDCARRRDPLSIAADARLLPPRGRQKPSDIKQVGP